jgi:hypothetical protein
VARGPRFDKLSGVRPRSILTVVLAAILALIVIAAPATAEPGENGGVAPNVRDALDIAFRDLADARSKYDASLARQAELSENIRVSQIRLALLEAEVGTVANAAYRGRQVNLAVAVLDSDSRDSLLHNAATVYYLASRTDRQLRELNAARKLYAEQQRNLEAELKANKENLAAVNQKKADAELALKRAGGGALSPGVAIGPATAKPAPRNANGTWPREGCSVRDPTPTGRCVSPRTLHAYNEVRLAGYTRYTSCFRGGGGGEHPLGKACDFSVFSTGTFVGSGAGGEAKTYGDKLAGWFVANASRLGVLYVIWYQQIWHPGTGWRSYGGCCDPASRHTNHVHLSMI